MSPVDYVKITSGPTKVNLAMALVYNTSYDGRTDYTVKFRGDLMSYDRPKEPEIQGDVEFVVKVLGISRLAPGSDEYMVRGFVTGLHDETREMSLRYHSVTHKGYLRISDAPKKIGKIR